MMRKPNTNNAELLQRLITMALAASLAGCTALSTAPPAAPPTTPPTASPPAPTPQVQAIPFDDAVLKAANDLFSKAPPPPTSTGEVTKQVLVIDPLIDGVSGAQSVATRSTESRIVELVKAKYPHFDVQPFSAANVAKSPIVLVGTFTGVNQQAQTTGTREAFRVCLALADLKSGRSSPKAGSSRNRKA